MASWSKANFYLKNWAFASACQGSLCINDLCSLGYLTLASWQASNSTSSQFDEFRIRWVSYLTNFSFMKFQKTLISKFDEIEIRWAALRWSRRLSASASLWFVWRNEASLGRCRFLAHCFSIIMNNLIKNFFSSNVEHQLSGWTYLVR